MLPVIDLCISCVLTTLMMMVMMMMIMIMIYPECLDYANSFRMRRVVAATRDASFYFKF